MRTVEVVVLAVAKPIRHEELVLEVVEVAGQLDDCGRVGKTGQIVEPVTSPPLIQVGFEAEEIKNVHWCRDLPFLLLEQIPQPR